MRSLATRGRALGTGLARGTGMALLVADRLSLLPAARAVTALVKREGFLVSRCLYLCSGGVIGKTSATAGKACKQVVGASCRQ